MTSLHTTPGYPLSFRLKADGMRGPVVVEIRKKHGTTPTLSIERAEDFGVTFNSQHWDHLRSTFILIAPLQKRHAAGAGFEELDNLARSENIELRRPMRNTCRWLMAMFDFDEKWASLRVPCLEGAMYVGLSTDDRSIGLSTSWRGNAMTGLTFFGAKRDALIEHVIFAAGQAKTLREAT